MHDRDVEVAGPERTPEPEPERHVHLRPARRRDAADVADTPCPPAEALEQLADLALGFGVRFQANVGVGLPPGGKRRAPRGPGSLRAIVAPTSRVPTVTSCPSSDSLPASAWPTMPAPNTAIFMTILPSAFVRRAARLVICLAWMRWRNRHQRGHTYATHAMPGGASRSQPVSSVTKCLLQRVFRATAAAAGGVEPSGHAGRR